MLDVTMLPILAGGLPLRLLLPGLSRPLPEPSAATDGLAGTGQRWPWQGVRGAAAGCGGLDAASGHAGGGGWGAGVAELRVAEMGQSRERKPPFQQHDRTKPGNPRPQISKPILLYSLMLLHPAGWEIDGEQLGIAWMCCAWVHRAHTSPDWALFIVLLEPFKVSEPF